MKNIHTSNSPETLFNQLPIGFKVFAKEELQKELYQINPLLDVDTTYVHIARNTENLTEALLKKSIGEESLLSNERASLYSHSTDTRIKQQIERLDISRVKRCIERLSATLAHSYEQHLTAFWETEELSIPQELEDDRTNNILKTLIETSSIVEKANLVDTQYPSIRQTISTYLQKKLNTLYTKDLSLPTIRIDIFNNEQENNALLFASFALVQFTLNLFSSNFLSSYVPSNANLTVKITDSQNILNLQLYDIVSENDILTIKSIHRVRLEEFWKKALDHYRALAKISYLIALLQQQESSYKLSDQSLYVACQAMGLNQQQDTQEIDLEKIPIDFLDVCSNPNNVEVSSFIVNNQMASDILKIRDTATNALVLYIPGYTPSFVEAKDERLLAHWVFHQAESEDLRATIASHFSLTSRLTGSKLDHFLYEDFCQTTTEIVPRVAQGDIFSFLAENQKTRTTTDLYANGPVVCSNPFPNHSSVDVALFTPITKAIEYIPCLLPNIQDVSNKLFTLFPHPHKTASDFMRTAIKNKWNIDLDPDKTFIGYFLPLDKPIAFEPGETLESRRLSRKRTQTLTEAALSNYRMGFTPFSSTTVVFKDPSGNGLYYRSRDQLVRMLPKDIEEIIKNADLDTLHKNKLHAFWNTQSKQVQQFIKYRLLQQTLEEYQDRALSEEDLQIIVEVVLHSLSLEEGEAFSTHANVSMEILSIDNYQPTDLCVFRKKGQKKVILYASGNQNAFFPCNNYQELLNLFYVKAKNDEQWQKSLLAHFCSDDQESVLACLKKGIVIPFNTSLITANSGHSYYSITTKQIEESLFTAIRKNMQERSYKDSNALITSDKELLLKRICAITRAIGTALFIPSLTFPFLNWAVFAAFAIEASVNLYIAKNGDTVKERHQAAVDAGLSSIAILVSALLGFRSLQLSKNQIMITKGGVQRSTMPTPLKKSPISEEIFFETTKSMQVWNIAASHRRYSYLDVKAWLLGEKFLLFTGKADKADHLIISSHGWNALGNGIVPVPENTELIVLGPHGWRLADPKTANIASSMVSPYGMISRNRAIPVTQNSANPYRFIAPDLHTYPTQIDLKALAGTRTPGHIKNYTLVKYQKFGAGEESYPEIAKIVSRSRNIFPTADYTAPVDVLTVRNRIGRFDPNLKDLFETLQNHGIHYEKMTLSFCRNALPSDPIYEPLKLNP